LILIDYFLQLNIHRFKVLARFGLMHVFATNICVWIRTLVIESLKEVTNYYLDRVNEKEKSPWAEDLRQHTLLHAGQIMGVEYGPGKLSYLNKYLKTLKKLYFSTSRCRVD
jgi:hypothetical protein